MKKYTRRLLFSAISFYLAITLIPTVGLGADPRNPFFIVGGLFLIATIIRPIFNSILLPINFLTLGLVSLILNFIYLFLLQRLLPGVSISEFSYPGAYIQGIVIPSLNLNPIATTGAVAFLITLFQRLLPLFV